MCSGTIQRKQILSKCTGSFLAGIAVSFSIIVANERADSQFVCHISGNDCYKNHPESDAMIKREIVFLHVDLSTINVRIDLQSPWKLFLFVYIQLEALSSEVGSLKGSNGVSQKYMEVFYKMGEKVFQRDANNQQDISDQKLQIRSQYCDTYA